MKRPHHIWRVISIIALSVISNKTEAWSWDWLGLYPTQIEAIAYFDGYHRSSNYNEFDTLDTEWRAGVRVQQQGFILDPGIARFDAMITPTYIWGKYDGGTVSEDRNGDFLSYNFSLNLLEGTPGRFSYLLSAAQSRNTNTGSLGSRSVTESSIKLAEARWKNPAFPMRFIYRERGIKNEFKRSNSNLTSRRDDLIKSVTARGKSSKLSLLVEHLSLDDRVPERNHDYDRDHIFLGHRLPWGRGSQLDSRLDFVNRTGYNAHTNFNLSEVARIKHKDNLFSQSIYRFTSVKQLIRTDTHNGEFNLTHRLYSNLTSTAFISGVSGQSDSQKATRWRTGLSSNYNKQNLFGASVNAGIVLSYMETTRNSNLGLIETIDESHIVPLGGAIILNRRYIIPETIIVTNADGSLVYTENVDYTILDLTDALTQLQIVPGGRINVDDTILVSYKAQALPSQDFSTTLTGYNLGINWGWVGFRHSYRDTSEKLLSGLGENFLNPRREVRSNLHFRWDATKVNVFVSAERNYRKYNEYEGTVYTFRQSLFWSAFRDTQWNLAIVESFSDTTSRDTDLYNVELSVTWHPFIYMAVRPKLGAWKRIDTGDGIPGGSRNDQFITAGLTLDWAYRKASVRLTFYHNQRTNDSPRSDFVNKSRDTFLMLNLNRRF